MRIAIFIQEDYDFTFEVLKKLIPKVKKNHTLTGVFSFPNTLTKYKGIGIYLAYLKIFGLLVVAKLALRSLLKRFLILCGYIFLKSPFYSFRGMYRYYGLEENRLPNPNLSPVIKWVKDNEIDVILLFVGYILKKDIIKAPRICFLNKHSGLLPAYRGVFPVFWAMMNHDKIGVTIHKVSEDVDGGEIVLQKEYDRHDRRSVYDYYELIFSDTADLIIESLQLVSENKQKLCKHRMSASYFGLPTRKDYSKFKENGHKFV